jgi:hypothetical protein
VTRSFLAGHRVLITGRRFRHHFVSCEITERHRYHKHCTNYPRRSWYRDIQPTTTSSDKNRQNHARGNFHASPFSESIFFRNLPSFWRFHFFNFVSDFRN